MKYLLTLEKSLEKQKLRGLKAKYIPYELADNGWQKNPEHEEEVTLLEYFLVRQGDIIMEGIIFLRSDLTLGRDRLDSFIILE